jgi:2-dehydro-3-deoxyphosphogluconate aldolase / (4S)-4-hydroxy-2-oxoglutarate aldolase
MDFNRFLGELRVVPVVEIPSVDDAVPLARALLRAGLPCAEITFRTDSAAGAIAAIAEGVPEVTVGAGTVLTVDQARRALQAGARFLVSPGFDPEVVGFAASAGVPILPGVCTPTEIAAALSCGLSVLKFFPAEAAGGVTYLKAIAAAYRDVRFVPTGGIGPANLIDYLSMDCVIACGGSWMVKKATIAAGGFDAISEDAAAAVALATAAAHA